MVCMERTLYHGSEFIIKKAKKKNSSLIDCYLDEANSSINVCEIENLISKEHADYLRKKYL